MMRGAAGIQDTETSRRKYSLEFWIHVDNEIEKYNMYLYQNHRLGQSSQILWESKFKATSVWWFDSTNAV